MNGETQIEQPIGGVASPPEESMIETHCYICQGELPEGPPLVHSKCGVNYHEECAKRVVRCPACGENLLENFINEQAKKKFTFKDRIYTILLFALPFVIIELLIGIWSMMNHPSEWSILPWFGQAFLVDLVILIVGLLIAIGIYRKFGYKPEKKIIDVFILKQKGPAPQNPEEQLYSCGYGGGRTFTECAEVFELGDVSIPNKVGVQRENIVRVGIDRLTMTPQGSYVWLNPRFFKLLKPAKNPLSTSIEELEKIWIATGRTKILAEGPEAEEAEKAEEPEKVEEAEEKVCSTCGGPLDYIGEYDAWYCTACGKYEEEESKDEDVPEEEMPPPPDEEFPPPDELPPPDEESPPPDDIPPPDDLPPAT